MGLGAPLRELLSINPRRLTEIMGDVPFAADFGEGRRLLRHTLYHATFLPLRTSLSSMRLRSASINVGISR